MLCEAVPVGQGWAATGDLFTLPQQVSVFQGVMILQDLFLKPGIHLG
jgi:hypothetical protein